MNKKPANKKPAKKLNLLSVAAAAVAAVTSTVATFAATPTAHADPTSFYRYTGERPLASVTPGTILKVRTMPYRIGGLSTSVTAVQLLYRTTDARSRPTANVASILIPADANPSEAVAYQSFYDSLNPDDGPSRAIAGDNPLSTSQLEGALIAPQLAKKRTVIITDTEGPTATFLAGTVYGPATLDAIRAATRSSATGLSSRTRIGLIGYSGGGLGTAWTAALAPSYAPDVDRQLVGAALGGLPVDPARIVRYVDGTLLWAGLSPMILIGIARAYDIDLAPYLSSLGVRLVSELRSAQLTDVLGRYPGLTWKQLFKPNYRDPSTIAPLARALRKTDLAAAPTPTTPMLIGQGGNGLPEGTPNAQPGIGPGDGVIVTADVRRLANRYCRAGNRAVVYRQYDALDHAAGTATWLAEALPWLDNRFANGRKQGNC